MIKFHYLNEELVKVLEKNNIKPEDLYNHYSDLYVGCQNMTQAIMILSGGEWRALSSTFKPQEGSEMDHYPIAVDIAFGAMSYDYDTRKRPIFEKQEGEKMNFLYECQEKLNGNLHCVLYCGECKMGGKKCSD